MAAWQEGLQVGSTVETGDIDLVFSDFRVLNHNGKGQVSFYGGPKEAFIDITGAEPGFNAVLIYDVLNKGSVPVKSATSIDSHNLDSIKVVEKERPEGAIGSNSGSATGELEIMVEAVDEENTYNFFLKLEFKQWNMAN